MKYEPITIIFPGDLASLRMQSSEHRLSFTERCRDEMQGRPPISDAVAVHLRAVYVPPPEWPMWKAQQAICGEIEPVGPPDLLALARVFVECCRGVAFVNESQITTLVASKKYGPQTVFVASVIPRPHPAATDSHQLEAMAISR